MKNIHWQTEERDDANTMLSGPMILDKALYNEKMRAEIALNSISDAVICTDINGRVDYLNKAAELITGWSKQAAYGLPSDQIFRIINGNTRKPALNPVTSVLQTKQPIGLAADTLLIKHDGSEAAIEDSSSPIHDWNGQLTGVVVVFHDVSATRSLAMKMAHLAQHDYLTNLPNRVLLNDRITQAIEVSKRHQTKIALLFLDLDNFKHINDSLGHPTGDKLLQLVASSLNASVRGNDTVSRQGGDEFIILLSDITTKEDAASTADKILEILTLPHIVSNSQLYITTSIGISLYPEDGLDAEVLIQNADTAMYHAKSNGRNNYQFFKSEMNLRAVERQVTEANLHRALEKNQFILHYQPKFNLISKEITGVEALIRWQHPEWGLVLPEKFIAIAEETGLIISIGKWILHQACMRLREWTALGLDQITVAVNISAIEFNHKNFINDVKSILMETDVDPHRIEMEITETVLMRDAKSSVAILHQLKEMGLVLAMDDFGTGYSSLSYLRKFPIDVLKIDRSFINEMGDFEENSIIVTAIINMGNSLKLKVIAEGIENQQQLDLLLHFRCSEGQGYLFSSPISEDDFVKLYIKER